MALHNDFLEPTPSASKLQPVLPLRRNQLIRSLNSSYVTASLPSSFQEMSGKGVDNRANQLNPNHKSSGDGRPAGYKGSGSNADRNNHANQMNSNNKAYSSSRGGHSGGAIGKK